ncbi:hypothetical protein GCM10027081_21710 [Cupriavidus yeoncheonensis]
MSDVLRDTSYRVVFDIDDASHHIITKIVDKTSGEVIRQVPTEQTVKLANAMQKLQGMFVNQSV